MTSADRQRPLSCRRRCSVASELLQLGFSDCASCEAAVQTNEHLWEYQDRRGVEIIDLTERKMDVYLRKEFSPITRTTRRTFHKTPLQRARVVHWKSRRELRQMVVMTGPGENSSSEHQSPAQAIHLNSALVNVGTTGRTRFCSDSIF